MDYELEARTPPSRRSRSLAWLAAASGLALAMFMFGSPGAASPPSTPPGIQTPGGSSPHADRMTTASIVSPSPVPLAHVPAARAQSLPLPEKERHLLIVLLFACFAVMAGGGLALWKRGWNDILRGASTRDD